VVVHGARAGDRIVLRALLRTEHALRTSGDDRDDLVRIGPERGGAFGGVQDAEASRRSRADVQQASSIREARGHAVDDPRDLRNRLPDGRRDEAVLLMDDPQDVHGLALVDVMGRGEHALGHEGRELVEERTVRGTCHGAQSNPSPRASLARTIHELLRRMRLSSVRRACSEDGPCDATAS
jgi:hypothetical protein